MIEQREKMEIACEQACSLFDYTGSVFGYRTFPYCFMYRS